MSKRLASNAKPQQSPMASVDVSIVQKSISIDWKRIHVIAAPNIVNNAATVKIASNVRMGSH
jgi:hypothetical protein